MTQIAAILPPHNLSSRQLSRVSCLMLCTVLLSIPCSGFSQANSPRPPARRAAVPADTPSGFFPGVIHYFAGNGGTGTAYSDGSLPTQVSLDPASAVVDSNGNVYIAPVGAGAIYIIYGGGTVPASLANVTTNAIPAVTPVAGRIYQIGGLTTTCTASTPCGEGLPLNQVLLGAVPGLAIDAQDNLYYSDDTYYVVRRVDHATSNVTTVAGTWGTTTASFPPPGSGGPPLSAQFGVPADLKLDAWGNLYINDTTAAVVWVVYSGTQAPPVLAAESLSAHQNYIYIVAGTGNLCANTGCNDGVLATAANTYFQSSIDVDQEGDVYIADGYVDASGNPYPYIRIVYAGGAVPPLLNLSLNPTGGSAVTPTNGFIYPVTGYSVTPQFGMCTAAGCGDGGTAGNVQFGGNTTNQTILLYTRLDKLGNLYVADGFAHAVRKIDTSGYASVVAGIDNPGQAPPPTVPVPDGGAAVATYLSTPGYLSFDTAGNLLIADSDLEWEALALQPQTITLPDFANVVYGTAPIALSGTASSGLTVQYSVSSTPANIATVSGSQLVIRGAGTVNVTASQPGDGTYAAATPVTKSFTVAQAPLSVTANPASSIFGQPLPSFTATLTGFVNGDTAQTPGAYSGAPAFSTNATQGSPQGTYSITPSIGTLTSANYTFPAAGFISGVLTITGNTPQTITFPAFSPSSVTYGHLPITMSATASSGGAVTFTCVSGPCLLSGTDGATLAITGAGTIVIKAIQNGFNQYEAATPVTQTLTVLPATLTVTGPSATFAFGTAIDPSQFPPVTIAGFVGSDTQSSVLTGSASYTIPTGTLSAGTYPISVSLGTLQLVPAAANNYVFATPVNGTLTITASSQSINFNPIPSGQTYGTLIQLTAVATSGLPVTFQVTGPGVFPMGVSNEILLNGVGTVTVTATQSGGTNYSPAPPVTQVIPVAPAPLLVQALNATREQGAQNPTFSYQIGCSLPESGCWVLSDTDIPSVITGVPNVSTVATSSSAPGTYPIVIAQGTLSAPNYSFVLVNGTLTVLPPGDFNVTANPPALTIPAGLSAQTTITITPVNNYQGTITFSCGQLPAHVTCAISPSSFVFPGSQNPDGSENPAQGTVTINTAGTSIVGQTAKPDRRMNMAGVILPGSISALLLLFARRRIPRLRKLFDAVALGLSLFVLAGLISCGGGATFTTAAPGTVTISVSGSGTTPAGTGAVTESVAITVVIQ